MADSDPNILSFGTIVLDADHRTLDVDSTRYHLTPKECQLLAAFLTYPGQVLTRQFLMKAVWDTDYSDDTRTLEVHVHWLRQKIERSGGRPSLIHTVRGVGYLFKPPPVEVELPTEAGVDAPAESVDPELQ